MHLAGPFAAIAAVATVATHRAAALASTVGGALLAVDRETALHATVGGGGMLLLAYAAWAHAHGRVSAAQRRGLVAAGAGFLLSTAASLELRDHGVRGIAVSLLGTALVLWGGRTLVRARQHERARGRHRGPVDPRRPPGGG